MIFIGLLPPSMLQSFKKTLGVDKLMVSLIINALNIKVIEVKTHQLNNILKI